MADRQGWMERWVVRIGRNNSTGEGTISSVVKSHCTCRYVPEASNNEWLPIIIHQRRLDSCDVH